jgi:hypothetical protein
MHTHRHAGTPRAGMAMPDGPTLAHPSHPSKRPLRAALRPPESNEDNDSDECRNQQGCIEHQFPPFKTRRPAECWALHPGTPLPGSWPSPVTTSSCGRKCFTPEVGVQRPGTRPAWPKAAGASPRRLSFPQPGTVKPHDEARRRLGLQRAASMGSPSSPPGADGSRNDNLERSNAHAYTPG